MPFSRLALPIAALSYSQRAATRIREQRSDYKLKAEQGPDEAPKPPSQANSVDPADPNEDPGPNDLNRLGDDLDAVSAFKPDEKLAQVQKQHD
ncbi:hypothetical protein HRG_001236 [Hirsutella rhossiliensis]|uniref:Uncharacterized protein n=1 Tax=Hirsutella rhossiliensis TaxID=111463 RepID=A0A9P8NAA1_9HYPO|nr:uncharacterized protein HRG_01236 [Hirsutella rhossiliensis]KAH0968594.1 hypothetical protein HRG_01236 [Hirsutella rhossiliensis]